MTFRSHNITLISLLILFAILLLRAINNINLAYPDADRILMDGVFIHDFLLDRPFTHAYDYALLYFAQYPALSIGYRPPFFPLLEALFNLIFGVTMWSSRLALASLAVAGAYAFYQLVARLIDKSTATLALLLYVTTPFVVQWGWYTMSELPVLSLALLSCNFYCRYTETQQTRDLFYTAIFLVLAVWTKQTAIFLVLTFLLHSLLAGQLMTLVKSKRFWIMVLLVILALIPLAVMTFYLGKKNIEQSIGSESSVNSALNVHWQSLFFYGRALYERQLTLPVFFLALIGMLLSAYYREKKTLLMLALVITCYAFFTYLVAKDARYSIFWLPTFCVYASLPVYYLRHQPLAYKLGWLMMLLIATAQLITIFKKTPDYATGYDIAAHWVLDNSRQPLVFFDGVNNGYFTYFMRALDPQRRYFVLRGDKLLSSSSVFSNSEQKVYMHNRDEIKALLIRLGVDLIVVENRNEIGIAIHSLLREVLQMDDFQLLQSIPVSSNHYSLKNQQLLIYRSLHPSLPSQQMIELPVPIIGKTFKVPLWKP